jgi:hypothetical protein
MKVERVQFDTEYFTDSEYVSQMLDGYNSRNNN